MAAFYAPGSNALLDQVLSFPAYAELTIPKGAIPHPLALGFEQSLGEPHGQVADYRAALPDGRGVHVRDMIGEWAVHWDKVFPSFERCVDHLREDSPGWYSVLQFGLVIAGIVLLVLLIMFVAGGARG
jgi:hypothetical protein